MFGLAYVKLGNLEKLTGGSAYLSTGEGESGKENKKAVTWGSRLRSQTCVVPSLKKKPEELKIKDFERTYCTFFYPNPNTFLVGNCSTPLLKYLQK